MNSHGCLRRSVPLGSVVDNTLKYSKNLRLPGLKFTITTMGNRSGVFIVEFVLSNGMIVPRAIKLGTKYNVTTMLLEERNIRSPWRDDKRVWMMYLTPKAVVL